MLLIGRRQDELSDKTVAELTELKQGMFYIYRKGQEGSRIETKKRNQRSTGVKIISNDLGSMIIVNFIFHLLYG